MINKESHQSLPIIPEVNQEENDLLERVKRLIENQRTILLIYRGKTPKKPAIMARIFQKRSS